MIREKFMRFERPWLTLSGEKESLLHQADGSRGKGKNKASSIHNTGFLIFSYILEI